jgi:hypothetical protein
VASGLIYILLMYFPRLSCVLGHVLQLQLEFFVCPSLCGRPSGIFSFIPQSLYQLLQVGIIAQGGEELLEFEVC